MKMLMLLVFFWMVLLMEWSRACERIPIGNGYVEGEEGGPGVCQYQGIPFAEAPVDALRFEAAQSKNISSSGRLDLGHAPPACPQTGVYGRDQPASMSEDCLFLNVFVPQTAVASPLPVLVFFYGGGFAQGYISYALYNGSFYANASEHAAVVVVASYRVGALGFLSVDASHNNFGLSDQRLALQWVQQHISAFGGDALRVTMVGQSAGAISVATHLTSPRSRGLFQRAVMESNPFLLYFRDPQESAGYTASFSAALGCASADLTCLRARNTSDILAAQGDTFWVPLPFSPELAWPWAPVLTPNSDDVPDQPLLRMAQGNVNPVDAVLVGTVRNEAWTFTHQILRFPIPSDLFSLLMREWLGDDHAQRLAQLYPVDNADDTRDTLAQIVTDALFVCSTRHAARNLSDLGIPTFSYHFLHSPRDDPMNPGSLCIGKVCHGSDLGYVFRSTPLDDHLSFTPAEAQLAAWMQGAWASFVSGVAPWAPMDRSNLATELIQCPEPEISSHYNSVKCDYWDSTGLYHVEPTLSN